jgi:hypothetical protein
MSEVLYLKMEHFFVSHLQTTPTQLNLCPLSKLFTVLKPSRQRRHSSYIIIIIIIILLSLLLVVMVMVIPLMFRTGISLTLNVFIAFKPKFRFTLAAFQVNNSFLMESTGGMTVYYNNRILITNHPVQQTSSLFQKNLEFSRVQPEDPFSPYKQDMLLEAR